MAIKAIIIDDDQEFVNRLKGQIDLISHNEAGIDIEVMKVCHDKASGKDAIISLRPDLVFLDIELPHQREGFDLIKEIEEIRFHVIFITGHPTDEYINMYGEINQLLGTSPFKWMTKPVHPDRLLVHLHAIVESRKHSSPSSMKRQGEVFKKNIGKPLHEQFILITGKSSNNHIEVLDQSSANESRGKLFPLRNVIYFQSASNYADMYYSTEKESLEKELLRIPLSRAEKSLGRTSFFRVHKSYVFNLAWATTFNEDTMELEGRIAQLRIPVGPSRVDEVRKRLKHS
ncbi:MAG: LytTR family DNA-binding domain-containing protein [Bacteroidota bacterium]